MRFGLACISAGTSLLFFGHFPTLKPTGQMFAPMTSTVGKFVCQGYVLGGYPPAAGAFVVARAVVCHAELVVLPSPNQGQSGWHRCPSTFEASGAAMRTRSGAARSGWSPKPAKSEQCSARPYDSSFAVYLLFLLLLIKMVYRRYTTVVGGVALSGISARPGWMLTPMLEGWARHKC